MDQSESSTARAPQGAGARLVGRLKRGAFRASLLLLLSLARVVPLIAQQGSLEGRVRDDQTATVSGARVLLRDALSDAPFRGVSSDDLGFYRFDGIPAGEWIVEVQRLGFALFRQPVIVGSGMTDFDVVLTVQVLEIEELRVRADARAPESIAFEEEAGLTVRVIEAQDLRTLPGFIEADPLRAAEALPGVTTTSDFSAAFNVRGGSADQNMILLDGLPIFNPAHLGGLVSVFNPDMICRATLQTGGFPAEYGGRVSSVLEIETDPGDGREVDVDLAVSLLTTRLAVNGGLAEGAKSVLGLQDARWRVSGRRSYFDVLFSPFFEVPYRLNDYQGIIEAWTKRGDRISVTGYSGGDLLDLSTTSQDFPLRVDWNWGNDLVGARWTHLRDGGSALDVRAGYSKFGTALRFPDFGDTDFSSRVSQATFAADWEQRPMSGTILKIGGEVRQLDYSNRFVSGGTEFASGTGDGWGTSAFVQLQLRADRNWLFEPGLRYDGWFPSDWGNTQEWSPRVSMKRFFNGGRWALKASAGRFTQFLHSVRDEELPLGLDIWVLTGPQAPPVVSDQLQGGVEVDVGNGWFFSAEAYSRNFKGVVTNNFAEDPNDPSDDYLSGTGTAYGTDLFVRRSAGRTTGWIAIGWLKARRTFPDLISGVVPAPDIEFAPVYDRRWDVDLVLSHSFDSGLELGVRWNLGTGLPFTEPQGSFPFLSPRVSDGRLEWDLAGEDPAKDAGAGNRSFGILLGPRNGSRYPLRHRLDASLRKDHIRTWGTFTPYINVINVYNKQNPLFYFYEFDEQPGVRSGVSMFPLLPTVGVDIRFR